MEKLEQPERLIGDGPVAVHRVNNDHIALEADGCRLECSDYNAWRLFGLLSQILNIPLSARVARAIHF